MVSVEKQQVLIVTAAIPHMARLLARSSAYMFVVNACWLLRTRGAAVHTPRASLVRVASFCVACGAPEVQKGMPCGLDSLAA